MRQGSLASQSSSKPDSFQSLKSSSTGPRARSKGQHLLKTEHADRHIGQHNSPVGQFPHQGIDRLAMIVGVGADALLALEGDLIGDALSHQAHSTDHLVGSHGYQQFQPLSRDLGQDARQIERSTLGKLMLLPSSMSTARNCCKSGKLTAWAHTTYSTARRKSANNQLAVRSVKWQSSPCFSMRTPRLPAKRERVLGPAWGCFHQPSTRIKASWTNVRLRWRNPAAWASLTLSCLNKCFTKRFILA